MWWTAGKWQLVEGVIGQLRISSGWSATEARPSVGCWRLRLRSSCSLAPDDTHLKYQTEGLAKDKLCKAKGYSSSPKGGRVRSVGAKAPAHIVCPPDLRLSKKTSSRQLGE